MATSQERQRKLIDALTEGTTKGRIRWEVPTDSSSLLVAMSSSSGASAINRFETSLPAASVRISMAPTVISGGTSTSKFTLAIVDKNGVTLEAWTATRRPDATSPGPMESLYNLARDHALKLDDIVEQLVREVDAPGTQNG